MATPFLGSVKMFGGNFAPRGYALCAGQLLAISQNDALFALIGTVYGGDGQTTFGLPDLRGRAPMHFGQGPGLPSYSLGQTLGTETVTLTAQELPTHSHTLGANAGPGSGAGPAAAVWAQSTATQNYGASANTQMNAGLVGVAGGNQPHDNMPPSLAINFIIALEGIFPSRN